MSAEDVAYAEAARELLSKGDAIGAERVLGPVFNGLKSDAAILHLMGLIKKAQDQWGEAERYLRAAIAGALTQGQYYNDLGVVLQALGKHREAERIFRAALALMPDMVTVRINLVRCLMAAGSLKRAAFEAQAFIDATGSPESWALLSHVQTAQQRFEEAADSAEKAWKASPQTRSLRHNLAIAQERAGMAEQSLAHLEALADEALDSAELAVNYARALHLAEREDEAEDVLARAIGQWPASTLAHGVLARLRWLRGAGKESTHDLEAAIEARPQDLALRLTCADILHRSGAHQRAIEILEGGLAYAPDQPALISSLGVVLDESGRIEEGLKYLRRAAELTPGQVKTHRNLVPTLLRADQADEALRLLRALRQGAPDDQELIAYEAIALRMLGDPAYRHLYDYERLVKTYEVEPPRGFFSHANFNEGLAESLRALHRASAHPLDQTLRNGSQTGRSLLSSKDVNIKAFLAALEAPIKDYADALLAHPQDPVGRRKGKGQRIVSAWSVLLKPGGFHVNHVHPQGWISSAYYVEVPRPAAGADEHAGWLKFGEPRFETPGCTPEKWIEPKPGRLVLFPSYMWHGTAPFDEGGERLSVAFDVLPI